MTTITLTLDDTAARKARQAARRRQATLEDLVRQFIERLGGGETDTPATQRQRAVTSLKESFAKHSRPLGGKGYATRDELYDRPSLL